MRLHHHGRADGPTLLLVHGLSSSHHVWRRNLETLGAAHRLLIAQLFAPGSGSRFRIEDEAAALAHRLGRQPRPLAVIGHSLGGIVALHLAAIAPELVLGLVLLSVPAAPRSEPMRRQLAGIIASGSRTDLGSLGVVARTVMGGNPARLLAATAAATRADSISMAASIDTETLLVWGDRDRVVPLQSGHRLAAAIERARLHVIPGAGHQPQWEAPDAFHAAVLPFLAEIGESS
jgi:pimeloyl-ACP methyl ester carboxylesterase